MRKKLKNQSTIGSLNPTGWIEIIETFSTRATGEDSLAKLIREQGKSEYQEPKIEDWF